MLLLLFGLPEEDSVAACEADVVAVGVVLVIVSVFNFVAACAAFLFLVVGGVVKSHKKTYVLNAGKKSSASMITSRPDPFFPRYNNTRYSLPMAGVAA